MKTVKAERVSQSSGGKGNRSRRSDRRRRTQGASIRMMDENLRVMKIAELYRPLKKPVTLRLDADVIAWFKKDGRRYQTRINAALRRVMEREMRLAS
jgi:uncharacterized protein (DUF4415 family)